MTCETCQHWGKTEKGEEDSGKLGEQRYCGVAEYGGTGTPTAVEGEGRGITDPGYETEGVHPGPKFGCIHWRGRPTDLTGLVLLVERAMEEHMRVFGTLQNTQTNQNAVIAAVLKESGGSEDPALIRQLIEIAYARGACA